MNKSVKILYPPSSSPLTQIAMEGRKKRDSLHLIDGRDERGITLQTVILTALIALGAVGAGVLAFNVVSTDETTDIVEVRTQAAVEQEPEPEAVEQAPVQEEAPEPEAVEPEPVESEPLQEQEPEAETPEPEAPAPDPVESEPVQEQEQVPEPQQSQTYIPQPRSYPQPAPQKQAPKPEVAPQEQAPAPDPVESEPVEAEPVQEPEPVKAEQEGEEDFLPLAEGQFSVNEWRANRRIHTPILYLAFFSFEITDIRELLDVNRISDSQANSISACVPAFTGLLNRTTISDTPITIDGVTRYAVINGVTIADVGNDIFSIYRNEFTTQELQDLFFHFNSRWTALEAYPTKRPAFARLWCILFRASGSLSDANRTTIIEELDSL